MVKGKNDPLIAKKYFKCNVTLFKLSQVKEKNWDVKKWKTCFA